jgi:hypothetical protein
MSALPQSHIQFKMQRRITILQIKFSAIWSHDTAVQLGIDPHFKIQLVQLLNS